MVTTSTWTARNPSSEKWETIKLLIITVQKFQWSDWSTEEQLSLIKFWGTEKFQCYTALVVLFLIFLGLCFLSLKKEDSTVTAIPWDLL